MSNRSRDVECPYCLEWQEVCHDDGWGYSENEAHKIQCRDCEKNFVFYTSISFYYDANKADCLNGSEHRLKKTVYAGNLYPDAVHCEDCGYESLGKMRKAVKG